jgi:hypothetical protein
LTNQKLAVATHLRIRRRASRFFGASGNPESELLTVELRPVTLRIMDALQRDL